jgi:hypothetical protein
MSRILRLILLLSVTPLSSPALRFAAKCGHSLSEGCGGGDHEVVGHLLILDMVGAVI